MEIPKISLRPRFERLQVRCEPGNIAVEITEDLMLHRLRGVRGEGLNLLDHAVINHEDLPEDTQRDL